jgi:hypothetical protein
MDRFTYSFYAWVWQHLPLKIRKLQDGIIGRFIKALLSPFESVITGLANTLYDQLFLDSCSGDSLQKHGMNYNLTQAIDESKDEFLQRFRIWRLIITAGGVKKSVKTALSIYTGVPGDQITITEGMGSFVFDAFKIGVTAIGSGMIVHSTQIFVFKIILPDLSALTLNRGYILNQLNEFSPSNEFIIIEKRSTGDYTWEAA